MTRSLLERVAESRDEVQTAELFALAVDANYSLACGIARRYAGRGIDSDDLRQVALLALVLAVRRFDPAAGRSFTGYAVPTISGELKRHFRDQGWMVRPPRALHDTYREVQRTMRELEQGGAHSPATADVAQQLGLSTDQVRAALGVEGCFKPASLDAPLRNRSDTTMAERPAVAGDDGTDQLIDAVALRELVGRLPSRDRRLLRLRFELDLTQREIGEQLGISQMQVSRLLAAALHRLRSGLGSDITMLAG